MTTTATHNFGLTLRPTTGATATVAAWFIPGNDAAGWVDELARWGVPLAAVRLYAVPTSARSRRACGLLAVTLDKPEVSRALPYATVGGRLFYPADAMIEPPVSTDELLAELRHDVQVLHPSAGLVGFAAADAIGVHDLLATPPRRAADWSAADAGPPPLPPLTSVEAAPVEMSVQELLAMGQDDIGSAAEEPFADDEPPAPEPVRSPRRPMAEFLKKLFGGSKPLPPPKARPAPPSAKSIQAKRERELHRLLATLKSDPDAGLQRALPLRDVATRGVAPPSSSLGRRDVNFSLPGLSGGASRGDSWSVGNDLRQQLTAQYREAANRELNLGRFRRAAYVFAHLLGDFAAAADALSCGRHFREAAAVHRDHLNNPRAAADCLAAGGLLAEAVPLYLELSQFELAGDLQHRLGQDADAADSYRRAVTLYQSRGDPVGAARLFEGKLADPDAALALLAATWPESDKAGTCLDEWFAMAGRLGRHEAAAARLAVLRDAELPWHRGVTLVGLLSNRVANGYPSSAVRDRAADVTRVVVGRRLAAADPGERAALVKAVIALAPADRLLARDGTRFLEPPKLARPTATPTRSPSPIVRVFRLPADHVWRSVVPLADGFLALGTGPTRVTLVRGRWDGQLQSVRAARDTPADVGYVLLGPDLRGRALITTVAGRSRPAVGPLVLPAADGFPSELVAEAPAAVSPHTVGACRHENGTTWRLSADKGEVTLSGHAAGGGVLLTQQLAGLLATDLSPAPVPMTARRSDVYVAAGQQLVLWDGRFRLARIDLPADARSLVPSPPHTAVRMIVTFDSGWAIVRDGDVQSYGLMLVRPAATFTPDGAIVAVGQGKAQVYVPREDAFAVAGSFDVPAQRRVAVLPAGAGQAAAFDADGTVYVYRYATR